MPSRVLEGKRVVVTGSGMGLGAAYAEAAADAGASVVTNDIDPELASATADRITQRGGTAVPFAADVSEWDGARAIVQHCVTEFGGLDGLVNNAGIVGRIRPMTEETEGVARKVIEVNVLGTIFPAVHAARVMTAAGTGGTIVNVSSGNHCGHALFGTYGGSKGAVSSLTYAWAAELGEQGVRVNAISPNAHTNQIDDITEQLGYNPEEREYPSREHNATVVVFLLSDLSDRLNGQIVRVDHGLVSVVSHPLVVEPRVPITWSVEALAEIFETSLRDHMQPVGVALADVKHRGVLH